MRSRAVILAAALATTPFGARGADLTVWWERGFTAEEDEAVAEVLAAFEQETGKQVEVAFYSQEELPGKIEAALEGGDPPDFAFGLDASEYVPKWAFEDQFVDLSEVVGSFVSMFDPEVLNHVILMNGKFGEKALYGLPVGQAGNYVHVWKDFLESAGFALADIPRGWEGFWSFWCDEVQPTVREATGRDDIWGRRPVYVGGGIRHGRRVLSVRGCV